jgi:anti-sigma regulatory factor (Ser/Thr protein kinase)
MLLVRQLGLVHEALFYEDMGSYLAGTTSFLREGLERGEAAMAAVPEPRTSAVREAMGDDASAVRFVDMTELGRNPARIIPAVREWVDDQRTERVRFVGEPIWAERADDEICEATRHEALLNLAFAGAPVAIQCPYDTRRLAPEVLADAERTHPELVCAGHRCASPAYDDPHTVYAAREHPLPKPADGVDERPVTGDLASMRRFVRAHAEEATLDGDRITDLLIAATEAAANTLLHGGEPGVLRIWRRADDLICEIADAGHLDDPLVGRRTPDARAEGGRGLWLINQLCDLVQIRADVDGLTVRLHMHLV